MPAGIIELVYYFTLSIKVHTFKYYYIVYFFNQEIFLLFLYKSVCRLDHCRDLVDILFIIIVEI